MTENVGPDDITGRTFSSQNKKFTGWDREGKGQFCARIFQLFEQKNIN